MFVKHPDNPIYGGIETGTLFDVYVTKDDEKGLRMDLSTRANACVSVAFSVDGIRWSAPQTARSFRSRTVQSVPVLYRL